MPEPDFVDFNQDPNLEYGAGDYTSADGSVGRYYLPMTADRIMREKASRVMVPVQSPSKELQTRAQQFLTSSGGQLGQKETLPNGQEMTVETHKPDFSRGQTQDHPGVTVREPLSFSVGDAEQIPVPGQREWGENTPPAKVTPEEDAAMDKVIAKYPNLTKAGLLRMFQGEAGYSPETGFNPGARNKKGYAGVFQLEPAQQRKLGIGDITKYSAADQIGMIYPEYLASHNAPKDITDADLGVLQAAPSFVGRPDDTVIPGYQKGSEAWELNPGWRGPDGVITVGSIKNYYNKFGGAAASSSSPNATSANGMPDLGPNAKTTTDIRNIRREEEGIPYGPEERNRLMQMGQQNAQALTEAYKPVIDAQANLQQYQIDRQKYLNQQIDKDAAQEAASRDLYQSSMDRVKTATDAVLNDQQPAPFNGNTFAGILAVIGQSMGAYGAILGKSQNWAANIIDGILKRDADRWAQMHLDKKFKVNEEKDLARDAWHQFQSDKTERQLQQRMLIDHELQMQLGMSKNADTQRQLGTLLADNQAKIQQEDFNLQRLAHGKVMNETISENKQQSAPAVDEKTYQHYVTGDPAKHVYGRAQIDESTQDLESLAKPLGLKIQDGQFVKADEANDKDYVVRNPVTGQPLGAGWTSWAHPIDALNNSPEQEKRKQAYTALQRVINTKLWLRSGQAVTPSEAERYVLEFKGLSRDNMIQQLNDLYGSLLQKKDTLDAEFPGYESIYDQRRRKAPQTAADIPYTPGGPQ